MPSHPPLERLFDALIIGNAERECRDIAQSACENEPKNFFTHVGSLFLSKTADGLIDPKLVLSWLVTALGGSPAVVGLLVPVREAGALLPQLFTAGPISQMKLRKYAWAGGSFVQGAAAIGMGVTAMTLSGAKAGYVILALLTVLALARSVCSVSYKDVLGKTVSKSRRGTATGMAGSIAAISVFVFAVLLTMGIFQRINLVTAALILAGMCWIAASLLFCGLTEAPGKDKDAAHAGRAALQNLSLLKTSAQLRRFILTRALLTATALAPPFMVAAGQRGGAESFGGLGLLVIASALSAFLSSYIWGRLSDKSSRKVLVLSGVVSAIALALTALAMAAGILNYAFVLPVLLFVLMTAYQGVRLGRSTHLVDMADEDTRAAFTALSNTVIGIVLIAGGLFSVLSSFAGISAVIWVMAAMCALAALSALSLEEVQQ